MSFRPRLRGRRPALALAAVALLLLALAGVAQAQTFTVTNLNDSGVSGDGSLRGELAAANAAPGADTIAFAAGLSGTIDLSGNGLQVTDPVDLEGPGPAQITVVQSSLNRVIHVNLGSPGAVTISGLHIEGGTAPNSGNHANYGGDILNDTTNAIAALTIVDSVISGGRAPSDGGGVESFDAPLTLLSSTVSGNHAAVGGGIEAGGDAGFTIQGSTISGNSAEIEAGGLNGSVEGADGLIEGSTISGNISKEDEGGAAVYADKSGSLTLRNSTVAGNVAEGNGGLGNGGGLVLGTDATGTISLQSSTVAANHAGGHAPFGDGGGILANPSNVSLQNTIVAGNSSLNGPDVYGSFSAAFSLIGNPSGATPSETVAASDLIGVDPQLGLLQDNGGPTQTMALAPGSPAVNKGGGALTVDQRGDARPVIYPGVPLSSAVGANGADIGAYELAAPATPVTSSPSTAPTGTNQPPPPTMTTKSLHPPRVRVSCPKSAVPTGCRFTLQVFSTKPRKPKRGHGRAAKLVAESLVATANVRPGKSAEPTLIPKPKFAAKLDAAKSLLVREVATIGGKRSVSYRRMNVVG
jgi:hypothetical protein